MGGFLSFYTPLSKSPPPLFFVSTETQLKIGGATTSSVCCLLPGFPHGTMTWTHSAGALLGDILLSSTCKVCEFSELSLRFDPVLRTHFKATCAECHHQCRIPAAETSRLIAEAATVPVHGPAAASTLALLFALVHRHDCARCVHLYGNKYLGYRLPLLSDDSPRRVGRNSD